MGDTGSSNMKIVVIGGTGLIEEKSNSRNAVTNSSARTTKRVPSSRCASAIQILRP